MRDARLMEAADHVYRTHSPEGTIEVGRELARLLVPPKVLILRGDLGAGKTTLVKGIAAALGAAEPDEVTSPTFTLIHEYAGRSVEHADLGATILLYHLDLYRIENQRQLDTLGIEDLMTPESLLLIEWGEKFPFVTECSDGEIAIETLSGDERKITLTFRPSSPASRADFL